MILNNERVLCVTFQDGAVVDVRPYFSLRTPPCVIVTYLRENEDVDDNIIV